LAAGEADVSDEWICGRRAVAEVFAAGRRRVHQLIIEPGPSSLALEGIVDAAELLGVGVESADGDEFSRLGLHDAQRVAVRVDPFAFRDEADLPVAGSGAHSLLVVLDHLEDPQNVGAILRTAEAAGCSAVCIPKKRAAGITPAVVRASAGAVEHLDVFQVGNVAQLIGWLQANGYWVVALDGEGEQGWCDVDYRGHIALVVGAEGKGVQRLVREKCDHRVALPLRGRVGSLNASAAFAAVTYEVVRQQQS
jgi:23S rRNA (guanosine2251-2'-O)-methyltransferase